MSFIEVGTVLAFSNKSTSPGRFPGPSFGRSRTGERPTLCLSLAFARDFERNSERSEVQGSANFPRFFSWSCHRTASFSNFSKPKFRVPEPIRTADPLLRRQMLYPPELQGQVLSKLFKNSFPEPDFHFFSNSLAIILISTFSEWSNSQGR